MKTIRISIIITLFLIMTSAVVPSIERAKRIQSFVPIEWDSELIYIEPYFIQKKKRDIEHLKLDLWILIKEVQIENIH